MGATLASIGFLIALQLIYWSGRYLLDMNGGTGPPFLAVLACVLLFNLFWSGLGRLQKTPPPLIEREKYQERLIELCAVGASEEGARALLTFIIYAITHALYEWRWWGTTSHVHTWIDAWGWPGIVSVAISNVLFALAHVVAPSKYGLRTGWLGPLLVGTLFSVGLLNWGPMGAIALHTAYNALGITTILVCQQKNQPQSA